MDFNPLEMVGSFMNLKPVITNNGKMGAEVSKRLNREVSRDTHSARHFICDLVVDKDGNV